MLQRFFECADNCGLAIPEDVQTVRKYLQHTSRFAEGFGKLTHHGNRWIPEQLLSLAGLAQHHGLPTRLLDWTRDHLIAAYFAAKSVLFTSKKAEHPGEFLVVWALRDSALYKWQQECYATPTEHPLQIITAPAAMNPNLHAQRGLFTSWAVTYADMDIDRRPLNQRLADEEDFKQIVGDKPAFVRVRRPQSQSRSLLQHLIRLGVTAGRLFPGFKGAADAVRDWELAFGDKAED